MITSLKKDMSSTNTVCHVTLYRVIVTWPLLNCLLVHNMWEFETTGAQVGVYLPKTRVRRKCNRIKVNGQISNKNTKRQGLMSVETCDLASQTYVSVIQSSSVKFNTLITDWEQTLEIKSRLWTRMRSCIRKLTLVLVSKGTFSDLISILEFTFLQW